MPECKILTVKELQQLKTLKENCYTIQGYISKMQVCPPCPKGMNCKPCPSDAIYICDTFQQEFDYKNAIKLSVHFDKTEQFKIGDYGRYSFSSLDKSIKVDRNLSNYQYRLLGYNTYKKQP